MKIYLQVLLVCAVFCMPGFVFGATYHVDPDRGSNSNVGSLSEPLETLHYAFDQVGPGDTILLHGGTYDLSRGLEIDKSGRPGEYIRIHAFADEVPILDAADMDQDGYYDGWPIWINDASWIYLKGLEVKNGPMGGVIITGDADNNILEYMNVHHNGRMSAWEGSGVSVYGDASDTQIVNVDSHHNKDINGQHADGFHISTSGFGTIVRGNRAWRNADDGFDFSNVVNASLGIDAVVSFNWAWENGYDESFTAQGDGNGFVLGGGQGTTGGHTLNNNLAWSNRGAGFTSNDANRELFLFNNTGYKNGTYDFFFNRIPHTLRNNISYQSPDGVEISRNSSDSNNTWSLSVTVDDTDFVSIDDASARATRTSDVLLPETNFLVPESGSDLIDAGRPVGLEYYGNAPDLGAFERTTSGSSTAGSTDDSPLLINGCDHAYHKNRLAVTGYGSPINFFSNARELFVKVDCTDTNAELIAGTNTSDQFVYRFGYAFSDNQWKQVSLRGSERDGDWYVGQATARLPYTRDDLDADWQYVVAYVCVYENEQWNCGCENRQCADRKWQLQAIRKR